MKPLQPSYPVFISEQEVKEAIAKLFSSKNWRSSDYQITKSRLGFIPHYYFKYLVHEEQEIKEGEKVKKHHKELSGIRVFDPFTLTLNESLAKKVHSKRPKALKDLPGDLDTNVNAKIFQPELTLDETRDWIKLKLSKELKVEQDEVVLSTVTLFYTPVWRVKVKLEDETYEFEIDGNEREKGKPKFLKQPEIPKREKEFKEVWEESKQELKDPAAWLHYFKESFLSLYHWFSTPQRKIILILIILALFIYLWMKGIIF